MWRRDSLHSAPISHFFNSLLAVHGGVALGTSMVEALFFLLGLSAAMTIPAIAWVMIAGYRLQQFPSDFRAMNSGMVLLFLVSVGTIVFPVITAVTLGTELPSLWGLQGLFLFGVLIVCGAKYPIERFYSVNLTVLVIGIALVATVVAAPIHAIYRNSHPYEEGRNFYRSAALELTHRWHETSDEPLLAVSGDDSLAFATAFYGPDHPQYARPFAYQYTWGLPRKSTLEKGWAAICFVEQDDCISWMERTSARASRFVRSEFVVQSSLLGRFGATRKVIALVVPPRDGETSPSTPISSATDSSANRRTQKNAYERPSAKDR